MFELAVFSIVVGVPIAAIIYAAWSTDDLAPRFYAQADGEPEPHSQYGGQWTVIKHLYDDAGVVHLWRREIEPERAS